MKALVILAAIVLVLLLIGQIRVGGRAEYGQEGFFAWIRIGAFNIRAYPPPPKKKKAKPEKQAKKQPEDSQTQPQPTQMQRLGGALDYARQLLPIVLEAAGQFHRQLQVDTLRLELQVGAEDPADAAMRYGQANAALGSVWLPLTQAFHVKDGQAKVRLDFDAGEMRLYGTAALSLKIGQIVRLGLFFGCRALVTFLKIRKQQKLEQQHRKAA